LAQFTYWLGSGSVNKTYEYISNVNKTNYTFCFSPSNRKVNVDMYIQYKNDDAPQRIYDPTTILLSNSTTNKTLYLLSSADGLYVTFQVINLAQQALSGVSVTATRVISGETVVVGQGITGASGTVTFWLNPDFTHTFTFVKTGYDTYTYSDTPTQPTYTINLGGVTTTDITNYYQGISVRIKPTLNFLKNNTLYDFNLSLTSSYWNVEGFGFSLYYGNGTLIGSVNNTTNGGTLSINNVKALGDSIYLRYYFIINGTTIYSESARTWGIEDLEGTEYSITNFFSNLTTYLSGGLLGATDFTRLLLSFTAIIMVVGSAGLSYGVKSQAFIGGLLFGIVSLLDWGLGFIPAIQIGDITPIQYLPTMVTLLIFIGLLFKEASR